MKDIFVEQFFALINPAYQSSPVHTMPDLIDLGQIYQLKIYLNNNMHTH